LETSGVLARRGRLVVDGLLPMSKGTYKRTTVQDYQYQTENQQNNSKKISLFSGGESKKKCSQKEMLSLYNL
jgi:hypothetical protein